MAMEFIRTVLAAVTIGLVALASSADAQQRTEITLARFFGTCESNYGSNVDLSRAQGECGVITTLINKFNAENKDGVIVRSQAIEWGPYYQQLASRVAARNVPTIAMMHAAQIGDFVRAGILEPITVDLESVGIDSSEFTPNARDGVTMDGRVYALPWDTHSWLWHVNLGLFKKAGLVDEAGEPRIPENVDEMLAQAAQVRKKTGKPYMVVATTGSGDAAGSRSFYSWLYDQEGSIFPDGYSRADFKTPAALTTFEVFEKLTRANAITKGLDESGELRPEGVEQRPRGELGDPPPAGELGPAVDLERSRVAALHVEDLRIGQQRPEEARHEVGDVAEQVGVQEDHEVAGGRRQ